MARGRPRKPTNVLKLSGAFKHNPKRGEERANEPIPAAAITSTAPSWMTKRQKECYEEIIRKSHRDVLSSADETLVEMVACLLDEYRDDPRKIACVKITRLMNGLSLLGMTPSDRSRVAAMPKGNDANPYAEFAA